MPWVHFTADFDWKPKPQVTIAYRKGQRLLVTTPCANVAFAKRVAEKLKTPRKTDGNRSAVNWTGEASEEAEGDANGSQDFDPERA
jgi:hypothetical protein